jgi:hypothetical protein
MKEAIEHCAKHGVRTAPLPQMRARSEERTADSFIPVSTSGVRLLLYARWSRGEWSWWATRETPSWRRPRRRRSTLSLWAHAVPFLLLLLLLRRWCLCAQQTQRAVVTRSHGTVVIPTRRTGNAVATAVGLGERLRGQALAVPRSCRPLRRRGPQQARVRTTQYITLHPFLLSPPSNSAA